MKLLLTILLCWTYLLSNGQTETETAWIRQNSIEISNDDYDFEAFGFLDSLIKNKRIVMLGENTHGSAEYFILKNRIIRYLHERHGFNIIAWESNILDCFAVESQKSRFTPKEMAMSCLHNVYRTEQVLPVMQYVKDTNMTLVGFDPQPTVYSNATGQFMQQLECISDSLRSGLHYMDSLSQTISYNQKRNRIIVSDAYQELLYQVMQEDCENATKEVLVKGIEGRIQFLRKLNKGRDEKMAENLNWYLFQKYPNEKFIIYAHNAHIDPQNHKNRYANDKSMAEFLTDSVVDMSYIIGIFALTGSAHNNFGEGTYKFKEHPPKSLENYLSQTGYDITFLDIENQKKEIGNSFLFEKMNTMYWGNIKNPKIVAEHYDGVILINEISPSTRLKK